MSPVFADGAPNFGGDVDAWRQFFVYVGVVLFFAAAGGVLIGIYVWYGPPGATRRVAKYVLLSVGLFVLLRLTARQPAFAVVGVLVLGVWWAWRASGRSAKGFDPDRDYSAHPPGEDERWERPDRVGDPKG